MIKKSISIGVVLLFLVSVISCEKDFTDIGVSVIGNGVFKTETDSFAVNVTPVDITAVQADGGINTAVGEYLLGIYKSNYFETIEASFISQIGYLTDLKVVDNTYGTDTVVITKMDTVFIQLPFQATDTSSVSGERKYRIDSLMGNPSEPINLAVYQNEFFLNTLDPNTPTQQNTYLSDHNYSDGDLLSPLNFNYTIPQNEQTQDTVLYFNRNLSTGNSFKDTLKLTNASPFLVIPLNKDLIKTKFLDKYGSTEFSSSEQFTNYFRGLTVRASATNGGAIVPFNFSANPPTLQIHYTNTVLVNNTVIDTITKTDSFILTGVRNSIYKNDQNYNPALTEENFVVQGTAGRMANLAILSIDSNNNGISDLEELRTLHANSGILVNDASLTFYIDQTKDTTYVPERLFLFKNDSDNPSQINDFLLEGATTFGGTLLRDDTGAVDRYQFRITNYISDLINGTSNYNPLLGLRIYNATDDPQSVTDTIVRTYNWNPRGIVLHSGTSTNETRKVKLKIAYSILE